LANLAEVVELEDELFRQVLCGSPDDPSDTDNAYITINMARAVMDSRFDNVLIPYLWPDALMLGAA
jgi:hypothetical protein